MYNEAHPLGSVTTIAALFSDGTSPQAGTLSVKAKWTQYESGAHHDMLNGAVIGHVALRDDSLRACGVPAVATHLQGMRSTSIVDPGLQCQAKAVSFLHAAEMEKELLLFERTFATQRVCKIHRHVPTSGKIVQPCGTVVGCPQYKRMKHSIRLLTPTPVPRGRGAATTRGGGSGSGCGGPCLPAVTRNSISKVNVDEDEDGDEEDDEDEDEDVDEEEEQEEDEDDDVDEEEEVNVDEDKDGDVDEDGGVDEEEEEEDDEDEDGDVDEEEEEEEDENDDVDEEEEQDVDKNNDVHVVKTAKDEHDDEDEDVDKTDEDEDEDDNSVVSRGPIQKANSNALLVGRVRRRYKKVTAANREHTSMAAPVAVVAIVLQCVGATDGSMEKVPPLTLATADGRVGGSPSAREGETTLWRSGEGVDDVTAMVVQFTPNFGLAALITHSAKPLPNVEAPPCCFISRGAAYQSRDISSSWRGPRIRRTQKANTTEVALQSTLKDGVPFRAITCIVAGDLHLKALTKDGAERATWAYVRALANMELQQQRLATVGGEGGVYGPSWLHVAGHPCSTKVELRALIDASVAQDSKGAIDWARPGDRGYVVALVIDGVYAVNGRPAEVGYRFARVGDSDIQAKDWDAVERAQCRSHEDWRLVPKCAVMDNMVQGAGGRVESRFEAQNRTGMPISCLVSQVGPLLPIARVAVGNKRISESSKPGLNYMQAARVYAVVCCQASTPEGVALTRLVSGTEVPIHANSWHSVPAGSTLSFAPIVSQGPGNVGCIWWADVKAHGEYVVRVTAPRGVNIAAFASAEAAGAPFPKRRASWVQRARMWREGPCGGEEPLREAMGVDGFARDGMSEEEHEALMAQTGAIIALFAKAHLEDAKKVARVVMQAVGKAKDTKHETDVVVLPPMPIVYDRDSETVRKLEGKAPNLGVNLFAWAAYVGLPVPLSRGDRGPVRALDVTSRHVVQTVHCALEATKRLDAAVDADVILLCCVARSMGAGAVGDTRRAVVSAAMSMWGATPNETLKKASEHLGATTDLGKRLARYTALLRSCRQTRNAWDERTKKLEHVINGWAASNRNLWQQLLEDNVPGAASALAQACVGESPTGNQMVSTQALFDAQNYLCGRANDNAVRQLAEPGELIGGPGGQLAYTMVGAFGPKVRHAFEDVVKSMCASIGAPYCQSLIEAAGCEIFLRWCKGDVKEWAFRKAPLLLQERQEGANSKQTQVVDARVLSGTNWVQWAAQVGALKFNESGQTWLDSSILQGPSCRSILSPSYESPVSFQLSDVEHAVDEVDVDDDAWGGDGGGRQETKRRRKVCGDRRENTRTMDPEYEVEQITAERVHNGVTQWKVTWVGDYADTWEPLTSLLDRGDNDETGIEAIALTRWRGSQACPTDSHSRGQRRNTRQRTK